MASPVVDPPPARGDVWRVDFGADPTDPEQAFTRPAVIVSDDRLHHPNLRMVVDHLGRLDTPIRYTLDETLRAVLGLP